MKLKLLLIFLITFMCAQAQVTDFITGITNAPNRLIIDNDIIYSKGVSSPGEIIKIDLSELSPTVNVLFTTEDSFEIGGFAIDGNTMYYSDVNSNTGVSSIRSFDLDTPTDVTTITSGLGFVATMDIYNNELYFTDENVDIGGASLKKVSLTPTSSSTINTIIEGLTNPQDMKFKDNVVYIGDKDAKKIYEVNVSETIAVLNIFINDVEARGVYVFDGFLYFSDGGVIKKAPFLEASDITIEAEDTDNDGEFLRDVVIYKQQLYMPQEEAGKIVIKEDLTLSTDDFIGVDNLNIYNDESTIYIKGIAHQYTATIYNLGGQELMIQNLLQGESFIDISNFGTGVYILHIDNRTTFKFIR